MGLFFGILLICISYTVMYFEVSKIPEMINIVSNNNNFKKRKFGYITIFIITFFLNNEFSGTLVNFLLGNIASILFFELGFIYEKNKLGYYSKEFKDIHRILNQMEKNYFKNIKGYYDEYNYNFFIKEIKNEIFNYIYNKGYNEVFFEINDSGNVNKFIYKRISDNLYNLLIDYKMSFYEGQNVNSLISFYVHILNENLKLGIISKKEINSLMKKIIKIYGEL